MSLTSTELKQPTKPLTADQLERLVTQFNGLQTWALPDYAAVESASMKDLQTFVDFYTACYGHAFSINKKCHSVNYHTGPVIAQMLVPIRSGFASSL